jgi:hypothetical protein
LRAIIDATALAPSVGDGPGPGATAGLGRRAAFGSVNGDGITNGFFDGDRVHDIGSLGGSFTWVHGLNKQGVVVGESEDAERFSNILAFAWTLSGGLRQRRVSGHGPAPARPRRQMRRPASRSCGCRR